MKKLYIIAIIISAVFIACGSGSDNEKGVKDNENQKITKKSTKILKENKNSVTLTNAPVVEDNVKGEAVYATYCVSCHGLNGKLNLNDSKDLTKSVLSSEEKVNLILTGKGDMMSYRGILSEKKIRAIVKHIETFK